MKLPGGRKIKAKHVKKAAIIALYSVVVIVTIVGMASPAFTN